MHNMLYKDQKQQGICPQSGITESELGLLKFFWPLETLKEEN